MAIKEEILSNNSQHLFYWIFPSISNFKYCHFLSEFNKLYGHFAYIARLTSLSEQQHPQCHANTLLMHFYPGFIRRFSLSKLLHTDSNGRRSGIVFKGGRERERERAGEGQFEWEFGQSSNIFPGCLHGLIKSTPLAQAPVDTWEGL